MTYKNRNIVSLFDGPSLGQLALKKAKVPYGKYHASEIDNHAVKVTQHHFPKTIQLGDVSKVTKKILPKKVWLLMGGSPCQGFSTSGKLQFFKDPRSALFFDFVRIKKAVNPKYFFFENVWMGEEATRIISLLLGVKPIEVNSNLVSAQNRVRLYWTNIPNVKLPRDRKIKLVDVLDSKKMKYPAGIRGRQLDKKGNRIPHKKGHPYTQCLEVSQVRNKSGCLTTVQKDNVLTSLPIGNYSDLTMKGLLYRHYTIKELCRLQNIQANYFKGIVSDSQARKMIGNGWTVDVIAHFFKQLKNK